MPVCVYGICFCVCYTTFDPDVACDDHDACTADACTTSVYTTSSHCWHTQPQTCADNLTYTHDSCSPVTGDCVFEIPECVDQDPCTVDVYDPQLGHCRFDPVDCDDGVMCTADTCNPNGTCINTPFTCSDGDVCTIDSCGPYGECIYTPDACDDGLDCTFDFCNSLGSGCGHYAYGCNLTMPCTGPTCAIAKGRAVPIMIAVFVPFGVMIIIIVVALCISLFEAQNRKKQRL